MDDADYLEFAAASVRHFAQRMTDDPEPGWELCHAAVRAWLEVLKSRWPEPGDIGRVDALIEQVDKCVDSRELYRSQETLKFLYLRWRDGAPRVTEADVRAIEEIVRPLYGRPAWKVGLGVGSFFTMDFGAPVSSPKRGGETVEHGEWHLWVAMAAWRLKTDTHVVAASGYSRVFLQRALQTLHGQSLDHVTIAAPGLEATLQFGALRLRLFPRFPEDRDGTGDWMLWTPGGRVLLPPHTEPYVTSADSSHRRWPCYGGTSARNRLAQWETAMSLPPLGE
ncbi:hypothetical protein [Actinocorallia libanotica]|uniref:Uncharacterized protein n=1 Tax=Actinocorallia libanotica TaxID=46162 RepID=A0ABP4BZQ0_9ACTN